MAGPPTTLNPPAGVVRCEPELHAATTTHYLLRNKKKLGNFISADVNPGTRWLSYHVNNLPKDGMGCPGQWLVGLAWDHFRQCGMSITAIRGEWFVGDNLDVVNRLTQGNQRTVEEAALQTWAAARARERGLPNVTLLASVGVPGQYRSIDVLFIP
jgi:hypothetical protein